MLQPGERYEQPFMPWVNGDFSPTKEASKEALIMITVVQTGDHETAYELAVPPKCSVADLKKRVEAEAQGLLKADMLEFRDSEEEPPFADSHVYDFAQGDLVIMGVKQSTPIVERQKIEMAKQELKKQKGCILQ
jgi:hypothetical protein